MKGVGVSRKEFSFKISRQVLQVCIGFPLHFPMLDSLVAALLGGNTLRLVCLEGLVRAPKIVPPDKE